MMTLAKVSDSHTASSYYEESDEYYSEGGRAQSGWYGSGAEKLGLSGDVDSKTFRECLDGYLPNGQVMQTGADGRRAGTDATFSAPKSLSLQALIGGDTRLLDAHDKAVDRALDYIESITGSRITELGITLPEKTNNLAVACFNHDLSRSNDPQIHTHCVLLNSTECSDGKWRALDQRELFQQQKLISSLYRNELARNVQDLGYEINLTHSDGRFELAHINRAQIETFSQRSQAINRALDGLGKTRETLSAREREIATLSTREVKQFIDRDKLLASWKLKSNELGINYAIPDFSSSLSARSEDHTSQVVAYAIAHTTERQAVVGEKELVQAALENGTGKVSYEQILEEITQKVSSGELIQKGSQYTTSFAQERELSMLDIEMRGRGVVPAVVSGLDTLVKSEYKLNAGQKASADLILTTQNRFSAIQGSAGTGKSTLLKAAQDIAEKNGYKFFGVAPSAAATKELKDKGIESSTIAQLAVREYEGLNDKTVLIVDEAGMVSTQQLYDLMEAVEKSNSRAVLVGDVQQLKSIEAGRGFAQLQEAGIQKVELAEIQRQHDRNLRESVQLAAKGQIEQSIQKLKSHVSEFSYRSDRYLAIAKDYSDLTAKDRNQTIVVSGTRAARDEINDAIRVELGLKGNGLEVETLNRKDLTEVQSRMSASYQPGDIVKALKHYDGLGMRKGDQAQVVEIAPGNISLKRSDGIEVNWKPALQTNMAVFQSSSKEFSLGDKVRITSNDYSQSLLNGDRADVKAIDHERALIVLELADGREVSLDANKELNLDHSYCTTVHSSQGQTVDRVLVDADTRSVTSNESSFYVAISRARDEVSIYTDDKEFLPEAMSRSNEKSAALDLKPELDLER